MEPNNGFMKWWYSSAGFKWYSRTGSIPSIHRGVLNCLEGPAAAVLGVSRILTWFYETKLKQIQLSFQPARTFPKFHELERSPVVLKYLSFEKQGEHSVKA